MEESIWYKNNRLSLFVCLPDSQHLDFDFKSEQVEKVLKKKVNQNWKCMTYHKTQIKLQMYQFLCLPIQSHLQDFNLKE